LFGTGLTTGTGPTTFEPDRPATRAEVVTLLWRIAGRPVATTQTRFPDVTKSWQREAVAWSEESGIALGRSPSTFDPDAAVTRAELVTFIWRSRGRPSGPSDLVAVAPRHCLVEIGRCSTIFPAELSVALASAHPGTHFTASVHDLRTGCHYELNPGLVLTTASVIKAQVLAGVLLGAQDEHRTLSPTESSQVELMMHFSHNRPPTSELYASIGGPAGLEALDARFAIPGTTHTARYGATLSTAADRTLLAEQLLIGGGPLDADHVAQAWATMTGTSVAQTWGITAGLPAGHEAALKNGFFPLAGRGWRLGSTGVVADPDGGKYAVTVMTDGNPTETDGIALVEAITTHINSALTIGDPAPRAVDAVTCIEATSAQSWATVAMLLEVSDVALVQMINGGEPAPMSGQRVCRP
jgi:hypothetical protein